MQWTATLPEVADESPVSSGLTLEKRGRRQASKAAAKGSQKQQLLKKSSRRQPNIN